MKSHQSDKQTTPSEQTLIPEVTPSSPAIAPSTATTLPISPISRTHPSNAPFKVFISHAGEDKTTIAIPLRERLLERGITAFVDTEDMPVGTEAEQAIMNAMETAHVGVFVMSPEFVARKWPMKELMYYLKRHDEVKDVELDGPRIIPFFYRLSIPELYDEPRLDRKGQDGQNLYEKSRFYERQRNGEAEANIAGIKAALQKLHGIIGVENFASANNDNTIQMTFNRRIMLQELIKRICEVVPEPAILDPVTGHGREAGRDIFQPHFDNAYDVSDLVFDFDRKNNNGSVCTQEGKLLEMLLDTSSHRNRAIAVRGISGVGKTSLLRKMRSMDRVFERFKDGVYSIEVKKDATREGLKQALISAVLKSGGKQTAKDMRIETDMDKVTEAFRCWFSERNCLFVIDDVWNTAEVTRGTIHHLWNLHTSGQDSKTLLTTRSIDIATYGRAYVTLKPHEALDDESRAILYHYASLQPNRGEEEGNKAVNEILERCAGLPLFLSVAGKSVKSLSFRMGHAGCMAYRCYADQLKTSMDEMITMETVSHKGLSRGLRISIESVEARKDLFEFDVRFSMAEMHRSLSVMKKQMRVPMSMLKHLWELEHKSQAARVSKEFEQVALADVEFEKTERGIVEVLRLHDSVFEFAMYETKRCREEGIWHKAILEGYWKSLKTSSRAREWWNDDLDDDTYIHRNVCRHLMGAGLEEELFGLLLAPKWLERQVELNGVGCAQGDFSVGIEAARRWKENAADEKSDEMEEALEIIKEAITLSTSYILKNRTELLFQVHSRLKRVGKRNKLLGDYVRRIESDAPKPGVLCMNELLVEAGGASTRIIHVGGYGVKCMTLLKDGERVACGCENGDVAIVNVHRSEIEARWRAHDERVNVIVVGKDGSRIVTASEYETTKVWDAKSERCIATFDAHGDWVTCIVITEDGKLGVSGSSDHTVQVWEMASGRRVGAPICPNFHVSCLAMFKDGLHVVIGGWEGQLEIWNVTANAKVGPAFLGHRNTVRCVALTKDERRLVTGSDDRTVRFWDVRTRQQIGDSFDGHTDWVTCLAMGGDRPRAVSGSHDETIRVWDIERGEHLCDPLIGHTNWVTGVSFLGGDAIVSCSLDATVRVWNLKRKRKETKVDKHGEWVIGVSFTPDGKSVVSQSEDGTLRVWDAISGRTFGEPMKNSSWVNGVAVTPDCQFVVSVSCDWRVRLWDLQSRKVVRTFEGHTDSIWCVAVTPDGERIVTGSSDESVRIWDLKLMDGSHSVLDGHNASVESVFVSDDGKRIISVDRNDSIFVWHMETQTVMKRMKKDDAQYMSRRWVLHVAEEATVHDEAGLSICQKSNEIIHKEGSEARVLGTLDSTIEDWDISVDKQTLCVGLPDGRVGFLKLYL